MLICDTHADTLYAAAVRPDAPREVTPETLRKGNVNVQTLAMYVGGKKDLPHIRAVFEEMKQTRLRFIEDGWKQITSLRDARENETAFLLSVEGCDLLADGLEVLDDWAGQGVRIAALTWNYRNCIGTPACENDTDRLTDLGLEAVKMMQDKKIAIDVSHLNEGGFWHLLEKGFVPLASHSCCRALCDHKRNLTDDQLKALFQAGGYVGVNFYGYFLSKDGRCSLETVADHLEHMLECGGSGKIGFGSDFDGCDVKPRGLEDPSGLPRLMAVLKRRFGEAVTEGIAGQNLVNYFERIDAL